MDGRFATLRLVVSARLEGEAGTRGPGSPSLPDVTIVANDIGSVGGMERQLRDLIAGLRRLGHHVTVVARTCALPAGVTVDFHRVRGPKRPFLLAHPWFVLAGSLALRRRRRGLVQANGSIVFNRVDLVAVHYCHQVGPANPSRATLPFRVHIKLVALMKRWSEPLLYRLNRPAAFVCVSEGVAEEMREHHPWLAARVRTIHNGVDTETFAPGVRAAEARAARERLGLGEGRLVALFVGAEWARKGLQPLLGALAQAPAWDLLVAGSGDEQRYRQLAGGLGVAERVRFLGVSSDVALLYQTADAFVLPTSYETFSLVTFEAAASGLPVLATPANGIRELVRDGVNGFSIEPRAEAIAARLNRLAEDPELRARLGAAARAAALDFGTERMVQRYHDLYVEVAAGRPGARAKGVVATTR